MNWKRGLYRVWMVGSVFWVGYWFWQAALSCAFSIGPPPRCEHDIPWIGLALIGIGGPLVALALGHVVAWIVRGFADDVTAEEETLKQIVADLSQSRPAASSTPGEPPVRRRPGYNAAMTTPIIAPRRNLAQRIANLLRKADDGEFRLTPWQLSQVRVAIDQLEEERFAEGERTMLEAERADLYEPAGYVASEPKNRRHLLDQLAAVVAATQASKSSAAHPPEGRD